MVKRLSVHAEGRFLRFRQRTSAPAERKRGQDQEYAAAQSSTLLASHESVKARMNACWEGSSAALKKCVEILLSGLDKSNLVNYNKQAVCEKKIVSLSRATRGEVA